MDLLPHHLAVHRGEIVRLSRIEDAWTECTTSQGETGWVPSLYLRLVIAHPANVGPPPPERWQASVLDQSSEAKASKHMMTARCLEQLQNLDDVPYLNFTAAELILAHHANSVIGGGETAAGSFLLWRPDAASDECKFFAKGDAALRRGFTPIVLSFIDAASNSYVGTSRNLPMASMLENAVHHPEATEHKLLWRIGGESGFTCMPAHVWQEYHGGIVITPKPWECNDLKMMVHEVIIFSFSFAPPCNHDGPRAFATSSHTARCRMHILSAASG